MKSTLNKMVIIYEPGDDKSFNCLLRNAQRFQIRFGGKREECDNRTKNKINKTRRFECNKKNNKIAGYK